MAKKNIYRDGQYHNNKGPIAKTYKELQALHILEEMKNEAPLPPASPLSILRAILQSAEIALLNLIDLYERAIVDFRNGNAEKAYMKLLWGKGFHDLMVILSNMPNQLGLGYSEQQTLISIEQSPNFNKLFQTIQKFDQTSITFFDNEDLEKLIAEKSFPNLPIEIIQIIRLCNHQATVWNRNLANIVIPDEITNYDDFVMLGGISNMVFDRQLAGDTYLTQFRALHQIPEILTFEINDLLESVILKIRKADWAMALKKLSIVLVLADGVLNSNDPIAENLTTADYHEIRENLGVTSGSHSEQIHYALFRDLYSQLGKEFNSNIAKKFDTSDEPSGIKKAFQLLESKYKNDPTLLLIHNVSTELLKLRVFIFQWRDKHLHLPRNVVGGNLTKSLKGARDAVKTVKNMQRIAFENDVLGILSEVRTGNVVSDGTISIFSRYNDSDKSLDKMLLDLTGEITKTRFILVQNREGIFEEKDEDTFIKPSKRIV